MAWVVPTHRDHFTFAQRLLEGVREHALCVDVHFVLGERAEVDEFAALAGDLGRGSLISANEHFANGRFERYLAARSVINTKKFLGLHLLMDRYDLLCTLDSELVVLGPGDVRASYAVRAERRAYPAHAVEVPFMRQVVQSPARLLGFDVEERILDEVTQGGRLYAWFEDVPTYESQTLRRMFEWLGAGSDVTVLCDRLSWYDFDHILYQYYCCCFDGWRLEDLGWPAPEVTGAWWELFSADRSEDRERAAELAAGWSPSWVRDPRLLSVVPSAFLAFHQDRPLGEEIERVSDFEP